jgi:hypothetical protein
VHIGRCKTACLVGGVVLFVAAAVAATGPQPHLPEPQSDLISGTVVDANGTPVSGAVVTVSLWPDQTPADGVVKPLLVASATTEADGNYDLTSVATPAIVAAEADNGGYANFELDTVDPSTGLSASWFFSAKASAGASAQWRASRTGGATRKIVHLTAAAAGVMKLKHATVRRVDGSFNPAVSPPCSWEQIGRPTLKPVVVGEVHSWTGQADTFTYGTDADTEVQIGLTGSDGKWKVGGSVHVGNSSSSGSAGGTAITGRHADGRRVLASFWVHRYLNTCTRQLKTMVYQWDGKGVYLGQATTADQDGACSGSTNAYTFKVSQTSWRRWRNNAAWFSAAVDLGPISVEAQSGYSKNVQSFWAFSSKGSRTLCGNDAPIERATRVFAGA